MDGHFDCVTNTITLNIEQYFELNTSIANYLVCYAVYTNKFLLRGYMLANKALIYSFLLILLNLPHLFASNSNIALATSLESIIKTVDPHVHIGAKFVSLKDNKTLFEKDPHHYFTPASNIKLLTAGAALYNLGPKFTFKTKLVYEGKLDKNKLTGTLYFKCEGDPSLKTADLEKLIDTLSKKKIKTIEGDIAVDTSEFDTRAYPKGYFLDEIGAAWNFPVSALVINNKCLEEALVPAYHLPDTHMLSKNFFKELLAQKNIKLTGSIIFKKAPASAKILATHKSKPLSTLLRRMLKRSDNLYADCIFKKLGAADGGIPGTWEKGEKALKNFLEKHIKIKPEEIIIKDGSGRSYLNKFSPDHFIKFLRTLYKSPFSKEFRESLAISGAKGSLKERMLECPGCIYAKTGTLSSVSSLSGYLKKDDDYYAFSILINGFVAAPGKVDCSSKGVKYKQDIEDTLCMSFAKKVGPRDGCSLNLSEEVLGVPNAA